MRIGLDALALRTSSRVPNAGMSRTVDKVIQALLERGPQHEYIVYMWPSEPDPSWAGAPNVRVHRVWKKPRYWRLIGRDLDAARHRLDVFFNLCGAVPFLPTCYRVAMMYDLFSFTHPEWLLARDVRFIRRESMINFRLARHLFAISEDTKREMEPYVPRDRVTVTWLGPGNIETPIPYGTLTPEQRGSLGIDFERYLFTLSTVEPRKNLVRFLEAFALIKDEPSTAGLGIVVAGGRGWLEGPIFQRVKELGLEERVQFLGYVEDSRVPALFAGCEFYVLPAVTEGFGMTVLEAMLYGAPVVCSSGGAIPEVAGDAACYFDPLDVEEIARAMREALADPSWKAPAIARGHQRTALFSWQKTADIILRTLEERVPRRQ